MCIFKLIKIEEKSEEMFLRNSFINNVIAISKKKKKDK